ncbi:DUF3501 family protein [Dyella mobilis]|uniref:DUF3501 family protein n=1 Tax=Dyella mobilis TaxID=1849582 RepID=A0ABS2KMA4_9GAMM|nr:DUF3501 family protein [Dyella mobilis]MBM7132251.1 DUF3501 family protein [Dyella mobilis]GLQ95763.1 hypothetical protein GCM10007863_01810 [Dyella mobilis]
MNKLQRHDLLSLETYATEREAFRSRVIAHKKTRSMHLGQHLKLIFEDRLTIHYQIQEMLRVERIFEAAGIADELEAYNPLIPDGANLKATLFVEYPEVEQRRRELARLVGIEHHIALTVSGHAAVTAVADEDMDRSTEEKTAAVHFLRFELDEAMIADWKAGAAVKLASTLPAMREQAVLPLSLQTALSADFA